MVSVGIIVFIVVFVLIILGVFAWVIWKNFPKNKIAIKDLNLSENKDKSDSENDDPHAYLSDLGSIGPGISDISGTEDITDTDNLNSPRTQKRLASMTSSELFAQKGLTHRGQWSPKT